MADGPALLRLERVPSTQDLIHRLAEEGAPHGTAVAAGEQTAGRGSRGRTWRSPPGGLWLSVLCRPPDEAAAEVMSLRAALAVAPVVEQAAPGVRLSIKWPNDLLLEGRKAGGILCEARWQGGALGWIAVGLGLNVRNPPPGDLGLPAIGLSQHAPGLQPEHLSAPLAQAITAAGLLPGSLSPAEVAEFGRRDALAGKTLSHPVAGVAGGISPRGALRVRQADGTESLLRSGTVTAV